MHTLAADGSASAGGLWAYLAIFALVVSVLGTEAGGLAGYGIGRRWGRTIMNRPAAHWHGGSRALPPVRRCTPSGAGSPSSSPPCMVSGIAKMKYSQFAVWNLAAGAVYVLSVGPAAYGAGKVASGDHSLDSLGAIIAGLAVGAAAVTLGVRHYRRHRQVQP